MKKYSFIVGCILAFLLGYFEMGIGVKADALTSTPDAIGYLQTAISAIQQAETEMVTAQPTLTSTPSPTLAVTSVPTQTVTSSPTVTLTKSPTLTNTVTLTPNPTITPTATFTVTKTLIPTITSTPPTANKIYFQSSRLNTMLKN